MMLFRTGIIFLLSFSGFSQSLEAQRQIGKVRLLNSGKKPLSFVQVIFKDAIPTTSDNNGAFELNFQDKTPGDVIFYDKIYKKGYDLVNEKVLMHLVLTNTGKLATDVIMAKEGQIESSRKEFYQIADSALTASFIRKMNELKRRLDLALIKLNDYERELNFITDQYKRQINNIPDLSTQLATQNLDDVTPIYNRALEMVRRGEIDSAINILSTENPISKDLKSIESRNQKKKAYDDANEIVMNGIPSRLLAADLFLLKLDFTNAENCYEIAIQMDSSNIQALDKAAHFYMEISKSEKAIALFVRELSLVKDIIEKAFICSRIGDLFLSQGKKSEALSYFTMGRKVFEGLSKKYSTDHFFKGELAVFLANLSDVYFVNQLYHQSYIEGKSAIAILDSLCKLYPNNYGHTVVYAGILTRLSTFDSSGAAIDDTTMLKKAQELLESFRGYQPDSIEIQMNLGAIYCKRAVARLKCCDDAIQKNAFSNGNEHIRSLCNPDSIFNLFDKGQPIFKKFYEKHPLNYKVIYSLAISYEQRALTEYRFAIPSSAIEHYSEATRLFNILWYRYPLNEEIPIELVNCYRYLSVIMQNMDSLKQSLAYSTLTFEINNKLLRRQPDNMEFNVNLSADYLQMADINDLLGNKGEAARLYLESSKNLRPLVEKYSNNYLLSEVLARSLFKSGSFFSTEKSFRIDGKALLLESKQILQDLLKQGYSPLSVYLVLDEIRELIKK
jgi:tetratricopeptide (TPR) repeat protein